MPGGLGRLQRVAHRGHLRVGEDHPRRQAPVGLGAPPPSPPRITAAATRAWYLPMCVSSTRPFTSPMAYSQSFSAACGRPPRSARPAPGRSSPGRGRPCAARGRRPPAAPPRAPARRVSSSTSTSPSFARTAVALTPDPDVHAALVERRAHLLAGERLLVRDQPVRGLDHGDLRPERAPGLRHLHAHHAAAEDGQARGHLLRGGGLAVGPRPRLAQAVDRRDRRAGAGGHDHRPASHEHVVAHAHPPLARESRVAADERDPVGLDPGHHSRVVEVVDDLVAPGQHRAHVEVPGHRLGHARECAAPRPAARPGAAAPSRACTRRSCTRRPPAPAPRWPPRARRRPSRPAQTSPAGPAPTTTTSNSRSATGDHPSQGPVRKVGSVTVYFAAALR